MKDLWRGSFKIGRGVVVLYCHAFSERQAWATMCRRIARRDGVPLGVVMETADYMITKEMEIREAPTLEEEEADFHRRWEGMKGNA